MVSGRLCRARSVRVRHGLRTRRMGVAGPAQADRGNAAGASLAWLPDHGHRLPLLLRPHPSRPGRGDHTVVRRPAPHSAARPPVSRREDARAGRAGRLHGLRRGPVDRSGCTAIRRRPSPGAGRDPRRGTDVCAGRHRHAGTRRQGRLDLADADLSPSAVGAPLPTWWALGVAVLAGLLGNLGIQLLARAYAAAEAQALGVLEFTALPWAALFGWLFFDQAVRPQVWLGALVIFAACWWVGRAERKPPAILPSPQ